jgi:putative ABC transport system ATP-binding protein
MFSNSKREKVLSQSSTLEAEATRLCQALDIDDTLMQKPVQALCIGQQQRVAIARALIGQPDIIIADEPTSALDNDRKEQFMSVLISECEKVNATLLFVSHDTTLKTQFNAVYALNELNEAVKGGSRVSV